MTTIAKRIRVKMVAQYDKNKRAKVGDTCICPACLSEFTKTHYAQKFCKSKPKTYCKDYFWNNVDENKRNNTTRISPASAEYLRARLNERAENDIYDNFHPFEGLNDEDYKNH